MCSAINIRICIKQFLSFQRKLSIKLHQENYKNLFIHMANQGVFKIKTSAWVSRREVRGMQNFIARGLIYWASSTLFFASNISKVKLICNVDETTL